MMGRTLAIPIYKALLCFVILPPAVGWVAAATLDSHVPQGFLACCLYLMFGGTIMWLIGFHILVLIMLYSLVTSILVEAMNLRSFQTWENNISEVLRMFIKATI